MERKYFILILAWILLFVLFILLYGRIIIEGDGFSYYALARSFVEDGDFDLKNQRHQIPQLHLFLNPSTHRFASVFSCGFGVLYTPFFFIGEIAGTVFPSLQHPHPYPQNEQIPFLHSLSIFLGSVSFGFLAVLISSLMLVRRFHAPKGIAFLLSLIGLVGTPLLFYTVTMPAYAHAVDTFLTAAAFCLVILHRPLQIGKVSLRNVLLGLLLSFSVLLRNNNIVLIPPLVFGHLFLQRHNGSKQIILVCMEILLGALPTLILLLHFNRSQYGSFFITGYHVQFQSWFLSEMLFHPDVGMFVWTPIALLALVGLAVGSLRRHPEAVIALSCVVLVLLSVQFQPNWWGGCSFGPRFFTHLYVFWIIGLHQFWLLANKPLPVLGSLLAAWTFSLYNIFFINAVSPEMRELLQKNKCRRSPAQMLQNAAMEYATAKRTGEASNPITFWFHSLGKGNFPTVQHILRHRFTDQPHMSVASHHLVERASVPVFRGQGCPRHERKSGDGPPRMIAREGQRRAASRMVTIWSHVSLRQRSQKGRV